MTLGSTPPWRACSLLLLPGRISISPLARPRLPRPPRLPSLLLDASGYRCLTRAQSTAASAPVPPAPPARPPPSHPDHPPLPHAALPAAEPSLLIDRLRPIPVRRHGRGNSVVVAPLELYENPRELRNALNTTRRELTQQARADQHWRRKLQPDWRVILQSLVTSSPTREEHHVGVKVIVPPHSVALLFSDFQDNLWNIKSRTKCDLTLYRPTGRPASTAEDAANGAGWATDAQPYILISGQPMAIGAAADAILRVAGRAAVVKPAASPETVPRASKTSPPSTRDPAAPSFIATPISHYPMSVRCTPYQLTTRADEIPRPRKWTMESFQRYVAALVMGRPHGGYAERKYGSMADAHQDVVARLLDDVFNDPAAAAAMTIPALKLALTYLVQSGETFLSHARALVGRAIRLGLRLDTEVYNILAQPSVKTRNLLAFQHTINQMLARGHQPDLRTWSLFLRIIQAEEVRRYIIHSMHSKNYFADPRAVNTVAAQMADNDIYRAIQLGQDVDTFLAKLRELYGPQWRLHERAANRYLEFLGRHGKFDQCRRLLEHMLEPDHRKPDTVSLNTVLTHCMNFRKVDLAVDFVRLFDEHGLRVANAATIDVLLQMARKLKKPHLLGAVWRYAHFLKLTSQRTEERGLGLLWAGRDRARHIMWLTSRLRSLWISPNGYKLSRVEFVTNLLLCDYLRALGDHGTGIAKLVAQAREQSTPRKDGESPQQRLESPLPPMVSPAYQQNIFVFTQEHYYQFSRWICERAERFEPAIPLGEFLHAALARDRGLRELALARDQSLRKLAHTDTLSATRTDGVEFDPVELPMRRVTRRWRGVDPSVLPAAAGDGEPQAQGPKAGWAKKHAEGKWQADVIQNPIQPTQPADRGPNIRPELGSWAGLLRTLGRLEEREGRHRRKRQKGKEATTDTKQQPLAGTEAG